jgi:hypothetical protein
MSSPVKKNDIVAHATEDLHQEEVGDYLRTGRSGAYTKMEAIREHDHGKQELARKIVPPVRDPTDAKSAARVEHEIEKVHEHRTMMSHFTL